MTFPQLLYTMAYFFLTSTLTVNLSELAHRKQLKVWQEIFYIMVLPWRISAIGFQIVTTVDQRVTTTVTCDSYICNCPVDNLCDYYINNRRIDSFRDSCTNNCRVDSFRDSRINNSVYSTVVDITVAKTVYSTVVDITVAKTVCLFDS